MRTRRLLHHMRLRDKLLLTHLLAVFLPLVLTNVIFYQVTTGHIQSQKIRDATLALESIKGSLRSAVDQAAALSYALYADRTFNEYLSRRYTSPSEYVRAYDTYIRQAFSDPDKSLLSELQYKVYTDNPTILTGYVERLTEEVKRSGWYRQFNSFFVPYASLISSNGTFSLVRRLDNYEANGYRQILKIDLNMERLRANVREHGFDGYVYLVDPGGRVQLSNDPLASQPGQLVMLGDIPVSADAERFETAYAGIHYLDGWTLHGIIDQAVVFREVQQSRAFIIVLALINLVVPSLILTGMSRSLHLRLQRILKHMKQVKHQNFQRIPEEPSRDEIGQLTSEFNRMTTQIDTLINDVYRADIQRKDLELKRQQAQLHALHSQINPHFLFNALESIRMRSVIKGEEETADIIHSMAVMFRKSISWHREWITLREELGAIRSFLEIQKYRFDDQFDYDIQVEETVLEERLPNMIFLPFVENASLHGIEAMPQIGIIRIRVGRQGSRIRFTLEDNGTGMSAAQLEEIRRYLARDDAMGERVGIKNTYYRLKLIYGDRFTFHIHSKEGKGTRIEIRLPLQASTQGAEGVSARDVGMDGKKGAAEG